MFGDKETEEISFSEIPDRSGTVVFCAYADFNKLQSIFERGIVPRSGPVRSMSYFPGNISLSVVGRKGYKETAGISLGWSTLYQNTFVNENLDWDEAFPYAFILADDWLKQHPAHITGVGRGILDGHIELLPFLNGIKMAKDEELRKHAFYEEIHFAGDTIPPRAIAGVLIDEKSDIDFFAGVQQLHAVYTRAKAAVVSRLPIYRASGQMFNVLTR